MDPGAPLTVGCKCDVAQPPKQKKWNRLQIPGLTNFRKHELPTPAFTTHGITPSEAHCACTAPGGLGETTSVCEIGRETESHTRDEATPPFPGPGARPGPQDSTGKNRSRDLRSTLISPRRAPPDRPSHSCTRAGDPEAGSDHHRPPIPKTFTVRRGLTRQRSVFELLPTGARTTSSSSSSSYSSSSSSSSSSSFSSSSFPFPPAATAEDAAHPTQHPPPPPPAADARVHDPTDAAVRDLIVTTASAFELWRTGSLLAPADPRLAHELG